MIINVNITCLLALASVYMGVASSLPSTATIKPVEFYLIYNLIYPFLTIILAVYIQVRRSSIYRGRERSGLMSLIFLKISLVVIMLYLSSRLIDRNLQLPRLMRLCWDWLSSGV